MFFPVEAFSSLELEPLGQESIRSQEREANILLVVIGVVVSGTTPLPTP